MDIEAALRGGLAGWQYREPPADPATIEELSAGSSIVLPEEYLALLGFSNGGGGELGVEPGWFQLWRAEEVLAMNRDYRVSAFLPGFFGFGSNGDGELLALDLRSGPPYPVVMVPFLPMDIDEAVTLALSFSGFLQALGRICPDWEHHS